MIYDFKKGETAKYILKKLKAKYANQSDFEFEQFDEIPHEKIEFSEGSRF